MALSNSYYLNWDGKEGPYSSKELSALILRLHLPPKTQIWTPETGWCELADIKDSLQQAPLLPIWIAVGLGAVILALGLVGNADDTELSSISLSMP